MSHDLFEGITAPAARNARSPYTIAVSIVAHVAVIGVIVIAPLMAAGVLPKPTSPNDLFIVTAAPPRLPPPPAATVTKPHTETRIPIETGVSYEPPKGIHDEIAPPGPPTVGMTIGTGDGVIGSLGTPGDYAPAPPPAPKPPSGPMKIGGQIREPRRVFSVAPVYPSLARQAHVQGTVVVQAVIGVDGAVRDAQIVRSLPLLDQAALDALKQWRYEPTTLNGVPVAVIMTVSVRFTLQ